MSSLLNKTRRLNKILQTGGADPVVFDDICKLLSEVLSCNVYIISRKGKVLGHTFSKDFECGIMKKYVLEECRFRKLIKNYRNFSKCKKQWNLCF